MKHDFMVGGNVGIELSYQNPNTANVIIFTSNHNVALAIATAIGGKLPDVKISDPVQHEDSFHLTLTDEGNHADKERPLGEKVFAVCGSLGSGHLADELARVRPHGLSL